MKQPSTDLDFVRRGQQTARLHQQPIKQQNQLIRPKQNNFIQKNFEAGAYPVNVNKVKTEVRGSSLQTKGIPSSTISEKILISDLYLFSFSVRFSQLNR